MAVFHRWLTTLQCHLRGGQDRGQGPSVCACLFRNDCADVCAAFPPPGQMQNPETG